MLDPRNATRNADILRRFEGGETLESIGAIYGITRERVRQLAKKMGAKPRHVAFAEDEAVILGRLRDLTENGWWTLEQASKVLRVSANRLYHIAAKHGITFEKREFVEEMALRFAAAKVKAGASIGSLTTSKKEANRLLYHLRQRGVASKHGRWKDLSHREPLLRQWRSEGKTWPECSRLLGEHEGIQLGPSAANFWAANHLPDLMGVRASKQPRPPKVKVPPKPRLVRFAGAEIVHPDLPVEIKETVRETAIANYGKAPASVIAKELGVTRNSIIGHWFRARQSGEIAA